jgi:hypothetical protein
LATQFLKSYHQGYFESTLDEQGRSLLADAVRIGTEWLGASHPAVEALQLGIAVHHGQLPRPFLREIEKLLKDRLLSIAISSPTLAQGVDLSFEVLVFSSLWRNQKIIPATEFANAIGRVGRAHVDIDGTYILPVFETDRQKRAARIREYRALDEDAKHRQMESGILLLLQLLLTILAERLRMGRREVAEYILNNQDGWDKALQGDDDKADWINVAVNELDNAIFSTITELDCPVETIADRLDDALRDSYWLRRLTAIDEGELVPQRLLLRSRARWLWQATVPAKRRGMFSAGVGYVAGEAISSNAEALSILLLAGDQAVQRGDADAATNAAVGIGELVFGVYPFACDLPETWKSILTGWLSGKATSQFANSSGIAFIQDGIVYRLVWAVEATRTTLVALDCLPDGAREGHLALCLTYGVPCIPAALLQQAGLASRALAVKLVQELGLSFCDSAGLKEWLALVVDGRVTPSLSAAEQAEWKRFASELALAMSSKWHAERSIFQVAWLRTPPPENSLVRVRNSTTSERIIDVLSPDLQLLGTIAGGRLKVRGRYSARVIGLDSRLRISYYGP